MSLNALFHVLSLLFLRPAALLFKTLSSSSFLNAGSLICSANNPSTKSVSFSRNFPVKEILAGPAPKPSLAPTLSSWSLISNFDFDFVPWSNIETTSDGIICFFSA